MEFLIRIHPEQRLTRIPKKLTESFGNLWTLVPNSKCAVVFPENADLNTVLKGLSIIEQELQLMQRDSTKSLTPTAQRRDR